MLNVVSHQQKEQVFKEFSPLSDTWVVADLKSKLELQKRCIGQSGWLAEEAILRANELWQILAVRTDPSVQWLSSQLAQRLIAQKLSDVDQEWLKRPGTAQQILYYIEHLMPLLADPSSHKNVQAWFQQNTSAAERWGDWYEISLRIWGWFLEQKWLVPTWAPGILGQVESLKWDRKLIVELGSEISGSEAEVLRRLSEAMAVTVIEPYMPQRHFNVWWPYSLLKQQSLSEVADASVNSLVHEIAVDPEGNSLVTYRAPTELTEIKQATAQVRAWLEQGVPAQDIVIATAEIEHYWPVLGHYLKQEGVPVNKSTVSRAHSFPNVMSWLAKLRIQLEKVSSEDLEAALFVSEDEEGTLQTPIDFERFRQLFENIYGSNDLKRDTRVEKALSIKSSESKDSVVDKDPFIVWALRFWPSSLATDVVEKIFKQLVEECAIDIQLSLTDWLGYLEVVTAKVEIKVSESDTAGIHCEKLSSISQLNATHIYVLGASEANLLSQKKTSLTRGDVLTLSQDLGYSLDFPDASNLEFELEQIIARKQFKQTVLSVATSDFAGKAQAPSRLWLKLDSLLGENSTDRDAPLSYWDQLQQAPLADILSARDFDESQKMLLEKQLVSDQGRGDEAEALTELMPKSLSVTQVEKFLKCPFIIFSEKYLRLSDLPSLDVDIDRMSRGKLMHRLFERLTEPEFLNSDSIDWDKLIDQCRKDEDLKLGDPRLWPRLKATYIQLGQRFLEFEKSWRKQYPATQTVGREVKIEAYWNQQEKDFSLEANGGLPFRGFIDRVDTGSEGEYVIIDYKSSAGLASNHGSWDRNDSLQLAVYSDLIEQGYSDLDAGRVVGAFYYVSRTMERDKGFQRDESSSLLEAPGKHRSKIADDSLESLRQTMKDKIANSVEKMSKGEMAPNPKDLTKCPDCRWRKMCRAQHMM